MQLFAPAALNSGLVRSSVPVFALRLYQIVSLVLTDSLNWAPKPAACVRRPAEMKTVLTDTDRPEPEAMMAEIHDRITAR